MVPASPQVGQLSPCLASSQTLRRRSHPGPGSAPMCLQHPLGCQDGCPWRPAWGPLCRDRAHPEGTRGQPHPTSCWRPGRLRREARVQVERGGTCPSALPRSPPTLTLTACSPSVSACLRPALPSSSCQSSRPQAGWKLLLAPSPPRTPTHSPPAPRASCVRCHFCQGFGRGCPGNPERQWKSCPACPIPPMAQPCQPRTGMGPWAPGARRRGGGRQAGAQSSGEERQGLFLNLPPLPPPRDLPTESSLQPGTAHVPGGVPGMARGTAPGSHQPA